MHHQLHPLLADLRSAELRRTADIARRFPPRRLRRQAPRVAAR
jgi:hypothetical protein